MNPTDQIAAEAANAICGILLQGYRINVNAKDAANFGNIIQAAIEKATEQIRKQMDFLTRDLAESRAHASKLEVGTCTCDYFPDGRVTDDSCPIHGAAHASEADG